MTAKERTVKIYTRTGDKGDTSLFTGQRVPKDDPFIDALGTVDECNCALGSAIALLPEQDSLNAVREQLITIQHALFDVGAALATPRNTAAAAKLTLTRFDDDSTKSLEKWIDNMDAELPKLAAFILPGGHPAGAMLHLARSFCRRAERQVLPLYRRGDVSDNVLIYLNRLSDYLFVLSRYVNMQCNRPETIWEHNYKPAVK